MTTALVSPRVTALAKVEARRYALHPVFLVGLVLWAVTTALGIRGTSDDYYAPPMSAAVFLGLFGIVVGFRLTRSMERTAEAVDAAPSSEQERVAALLLACLLPGALGMVGAVLCFALPEVAGDWVYGGWDAGERFAIVLAMSGVCALGGPLLGVMSARWLRFPGAVVVPAVAVPVWCAVGNGGSSMDRESLSWLMIRLFSPFAFFTTLDTDGGQHKLESWRGNPWFFLLWTLLLCAFAGVVALLRGAEGATSRTLRRVLAVVVVAALASFVLAVATGPRHATFHSPSGVARIP